MSVVNIRVKETDWDEAGDTQQELDWFPRPQLTSRTGFGQPLRKIHHPHNIVFIKVELQLLEFTKRLKCPFIPAKVV